MAWTAYFLSIRFFLNMPTTARNFRVTWAMYHYWYPRSNTHVHSSLSRRTEPCLIRCLGHTRTPLHLRRLRVPCFLVSEFLLFRHQFLVLSKHIQRVSA